MDIIFKEQFCGVFFMHVVTLYMHMLLVCLLIAQNKTDMLSLEGKVSDMFSLEVGFMTCQTGQKINWAENNKGSFTTWDLLVFEGLIS